MATSASASEFILGHTSIHPRHGDPFPLPRLSHDGRSCPQSSVERLQRRVDASARTLNHLAAVPFVAGPATRRLPLTQVQQWIMDDLHRRVARYGECPDDVTEHTVMSDLGRRSDLYNQEAKHLVGADLSKIKILKRRLIPKDAKALAPPEAVGYLKHFGELVERTPREMEYLQASGTLVKLYWDPGLRCSRRRRLELCKALFAANLLDFRRRRKARVGFFTVHKKDGAQRLILDARQANACHRAPPTTRLSTPASLTALDLTAQTLEADGFGGIYGEEGPTVTAESGDVGDCFYNFSIQEATAWFCTDDAFSKEELKEELGIDVTNVYDDDRQHNTPLEPGEKVFCAFKGVPMGWSWALYFANEIICHQVGASSERPGHDEIRDRHPPPRLLPRQPVVGTYVDNVHVFEGVRQAKRATE